jgi:hypothetical protein
MRARLRNSPHHDHTTSKALGLMVVAVPCLITFGLLLFSGNELNLRRAPKHPVSRLDSRPYFAHPPAFSLVHVPLPISTTPNTTISASSDMPAETPLTAVSIKEYIQWLEKTDQAKQAMFQRAVELVPRLQEAVSYGASQSATSVERVPPSADTVEAEYSAAILPTDDWDHLIAVVDRQPYPLPCRDLHDRYVLHLKALRSLFVLAMEALETHKGTPVETQKDGDASTVEQARGQLEAETNAAETALADLCRQSKQQKSFVIALPLASP